MSNLSANSFKYALLFPESTPQKCFQLLPAETRFCYPFYRFFFWRGRWRKGGGAKMGWIL